MSEQPEKCPLCGGPSVSKLEVIPTPKIVAAWDKDLRIDIRSEIGAIPEFVVWRCDRCTVQFFTPDAGQGSPDLYVKLEKFDWYYLPAKWEHDVALADVRGARRGLEIGCGFGAFVERAVRAGLRFEGCEQNPNAVRVARSKGLVVHELTAEQLAAEKTGEYDTICSFQVLEHVAEPGQFLEACVQLLSPGGKLLLGVPNSKSFLGRIFQVLDMPPHHMTRWNDDVMRKIPGSFPLRLERIGYEPLMDLHIEGYVDVQLKALSELAYGLRIPGRVRNALVRLVRRTGMRQLLRGQTLYAAYTRV